MNTPIYTPVVRIQQLREKYGAGLIEAIWRNLSGVHNQKELTLQLSFLSLLRCYEFQTRLRELTQSLSGSLALACMATLSRQFVLSPPFNNKQNFEAANITDQIAHFPDSWKILLWQAGQLKTFEETSPDIWVHSQVERWLLEQLSEAPKIACSYDAVRKTRERLKKQLQSSYDKMIAEIARNHNSSKSALSIWIPTSEIETEHPQELDAHLQKLVEECGSSELNTPSAFIADVETYGVYRKRNTDHTLFSSRLEAHVAKLKEDHIQKTKARIDERLAKLAESIGATSACLLIPTPYRESKDLSLRILVSHNVDPCPQDDELHIPIPKGIVGRAFLTKRYQLVSDIKQDSEYLEWIPDTQSELAVPLIEPASGSCLAVVNFESPIPNWFSQIHALVALSRIRELVPDVIVHQSLVNADLNILSWHFRNPNWSLDTSISACCKLMKESLRHAYGVKVSVVIWESDLEKGVFWVRGTSDYDNEYTVGDGLSHKSFVGRVFKSSEPTSCTIEEAEKMGFVRGDKARILGVKWVTATPIADPTNKSDAWGVITIYGYRAQEAVDKQLLVKLADQIGGSIRYWDNVRSVVAFAYAAMKMGRVSERGKAQSEACREILKEVFSGHGVTVFLRSGTKVCCQTTTGLENAEGETVTDIKQAVYDLEADKVGATLFLALNPGVTVRKNDATNDDEYVTGPSNRSVVEFSQLFRETGTSGGMERRRFLGIGYTSGSDLSTACSDSVVRIVRRSGAKPFRQIDCLVLKNVMNAIGPLLEPEPACPKENVYCRIDIATISLLQSELAASKECENITVYLVRGDETFHLHGEEKKYRQNTNRQDSHSLVDSKLLNLAAKHLNTPNSNVCVLSTLKGISVVCPIFVRIGKDVCHLLVESFFNFGVDISYLTKCVLNAVSLGHRLNMVIGLHTLLVDDPSLIRQFNNFSKLADIITPHKKIVTAQECWNPSFTLDGSIFVKNITLGSLLIGDSVAGCSVWKAMLSLRHAFCANSFDVTKSVGPQVNDWEIWELTSCWSPSTTLG